MSPYNWSLKHAPINIMIKATYTAQLLSDWVNIKHGIIYYVNWSEGNCEDYTTEIGKRLLVLPRRIYSKTW